MFCPKCGQRNIDDALFCQHCGYKYVPLPPNPQATPITSKQVPHPQPAQQNPVQPIHTAPMQQPVYTQPCAVPIYPPKTPVVAAVKKVFSSPLFLTAIILFCVCFFAQSFLGAILAEISVFEATNTFNSLHYSFIYAFNYTLIYNFNIFRFGIGGHIFKLFAVFEYLPFILMTIGLWITFVSAKNKHSSLMKPYGLFLLKIATLINLVCASGMALCYGIFLLPRIADSYYSSAIVFWVLEFSLRIFLQITLFTCFNSVLQSGSTGILKGKIPFLSAILCFIFGGFNTLSAILSFSSRSAYYYYYYRCYGYNPLFDVEKASDLPPLISMFLLFIYAATYILLGLVLLKGRSALKKASSEQAVKQEKAEEIGDPAHTAQ